MLRTLISPLIALLTVAALVLAPLAHQGEAVAVMAPSADLLLEDGACHHSACPDRPVMATCQAASCLGFCGVALAFALSAPAAPGRPQPLPAARLVGIEPIPDPSPPKPGHG